MKAKMFDVFVWAMTFVFVGMIFILPETVPMHWNFNWEIDGYGSRYFMLIYALLPLFSYYGMLLTMKIDPKRKDFQGREKTYHILRKFLSVLFVGLGLFFFYMTLNPGTNGTMIIMIILGVMFIGIGNYMPKLPQNYFLGIKTPWTLSNDVVWKKTHIIGGYTFVVLGALYLLCGIISFEYSFVLLIIGMLLDVVITFGYSYYIYKKLSHKED